MWSTLTAIMAIASAPASDSVPFLVSGAWLAEHLKDPKLVMLQIGDQTTKPLYDQGHIPGALFLNPFEELARPRQEGALFLELPDLAQLAATLERKGISNDSHVVLYWAQEYFSPTSRAFLTLEYAGLRGRVSILDGGLEGWKAEGRPVSTEVPAPAPGKFTPRPVAEIVVDAGWVRDNLKNQSVAIVDARDTSFYNGRETRQARSGRIPGAVSVPFASMVTEGAKFKSLDQLRGIFAAAGIEKGDKVVTYCHIGQQATLVWFVARMLGHDAALYDGSFQDWAQRSELPVVSGKP
jgi:thiosulfate/3-mercaptopyruvate sulfurtransferase